MNAVTLDLELLVSPRVLAVWLRTNPVCGSYAIADQIAEQIEAQLKPEEPTGLGAVVEDSAGTQWVRNPDLDVHCKWRSADRSWRTYAAIDAAKVLSEGVTL